MLDKRILLILVLITALVAIPTSISSEEKMPESSELMNSTAQKIGSDDTYTPTLAYDDYYYIWFTSELDQTDIVSWSFSGSNSFVGITVYAMDDYNFGLWDSGQTATAWTLSDGSFYIDSGEFVPPHYDIWYFVFYNIDSDAQSTTLTIDISSAKTEPYFYSFDHLRHDTDNDGYYDSVTATFDPDLPTGWPVDNEGEVDVILDLYNDANNFIKSTSETYILSGDTAMDYELSLGDVSVIDFYYIYATISLKGSGTITDTFTTSDFAIAPIGYGLPFVESVSIVGVDSNSDGYLDGFTANYDINFNADVSGDVDVKLELIKSSDSNVVDSHTTTHFVDSTTVDNFSHTFNTLTTHDDYYVKIGVRQSGSTTYHGETESSHLLGYPLEALRAEFFSVEYEPYSSDGIHQDSLKVFADPNFIYEGVAESVTIKAELLDSSDIVVNSIEESFPITFDTEDNFELDLGSVDTSGQYRIKLYLYLEGETSELDSASSELFSLETADETTSDTSTANGDGGDGENGGGQETALPEIPFSNLIVILSAIFAIAIAKYKTKPNYVI